MNVQEQICEVSFRACQSGSNQLSLLRATPGREVKRSLTARVSYEVRCKLVPTSPPLSCRKTFEAPPTGVLSEGLLVPSQSPYAAFGPVLRDNAMVLPSPTSPASSLNSTAPRPLQPYLFTTPYEYYQCLIATVSSPWSAVFFSRSDFNFTLRPYTDIKPLGDL